MNDVSVFDSLLVRQCVLLVAVLISAFGSSGWVDVISETSALESGPQSRASACAFTNTAGD
jgi:hypothetical protein